MDINTPLYADGSVELLQSSNSLTIYYIDGGLYFVHEDLFTNESGLVIPIFMSNYLRQMGA